MTVAETEPYADTRAHLLEELHRVELLVRQHVEELWADPSSQGDGGGFYVSAEEVDRLLATEFGDVTERTEHEDGDGANRGSHSPADRLAAATESVRDRAARSIEEGIDLRLVSLVREFGLTQLEVDALLLALASDINRKYERVYGYLRDDITRSRPTIGLVLRILADSESERLALLELFDERSTLIRAGLVQVIDGPTDLARELRVDPRVVEYLLGSDTVASELRGSATVVDPGVGGSDSTGVLGNAPADAERRQRLAALSKRLDESLNGDCPQGERDPILAAFVGPDERAAEAAVTEVCAAAGRPILRVDGNALSVDSLRQELAVVRREARLQDAYIHVTAVDALERDEGSRSPSLDTATDTPSGSNVGLDRLLTELDDFPGTVFVSGDAGITARLQPTLDGHEFVRIGFPRPNYEQRKAIWDDVAELPADVDPATLAGTFRLTRGEIEDVISTAQSLADGEIGASDVREACRIHSRKDLEDLATEVDPTYGWGDIVLPEDTLQHLHEIAASVRHRGTVFEEWGFAGRFSLGNGLTVLFTGPSGTGKTMAAEIIARDVGLPLYKVDLSSIVSKYIGETEKNLGRVFDRAEHSNAILFFDEADALFGKRTEVSDSHDRYANVEIDYLLQRMEEQDGCVIMATNLQENIDDAFQRRINATVEFPMPDADARAEIWGSIFPEETPTGELDVEFLAEFELSGGSIKNVALAAAFMAADDGETVEMDYVVRALRRELQKAGKLFDIEKFGEYREAIE